MPMEGRKPNDREKKEEVETQKIKTTTQNTVQTV